MIRIVLVTVAVVFLFVGVYAIFDKPFWIKYNCDMISFHPDIPARVKEQCRRAHNDQ